MTSKPLNRSLPIPKRTRRYTTPLEMLQAHTAAQVSSAETYYYTNLLLNCFDYAPMFGGIYAHEFRIAPRDYGALAIIKGHRGKEPVIAFVKGASFRSAFFNTASLMRVGQMTWGADKWAQR